MGQTLEIRVAAIDDARGVAIVHVASWQTAYRGLMTDDLLDGLSVEQREGGWRRIIGDQNAAAHTIVADRDGDIVGWASFGSGRDEGASEQGELWGLYAHPNAFSTGVGHALISAVDTALRQEGFSSAYLWVLDGNDRADAQPNRQHSPHLGMAAISDGWAKGVAGPAATCTAGGEQETRATPDRAASNPRTSRCARRRTTCL